MSSRRDQISAGVTRYLRRYLQISADIYEDKCVQYHTIFSARGTTTMSPPSHADRALPEDRSRLSNSSRSSRPHPCSPPPPSRRRPALLSSRPPSPRGASPPFSGGGRGGGVVVVVVIRVRAPHVIKETPSVVVVRMMGEDDRPSPTTTRHVLPLWQHRRDVVCRVHDNNEGTVAPPQGLEFFKDVEGDYYNGLQNKDGEDHIATGSAVLRPCQTWGGGMTDTALAMLTVGIATPHLRMHRCELQRGRRRQ
jgi:hypothetical protein